MDSLHDVIFRYAGAKIAIYPLMDTLQLLIQKPTVYSIFRTDGASACDLVFTTFQDPDLNFRPRFKDAIERIAAEIRCKSKSHYLPIIQPGDVCYRNQQQLYLSAHLLQFRDGIICFDPLEEDDETLLRDLIDGIKDSPPTYSVRILEVFSQALTHSPIVFDHTKLPPEERLEKYARADDGVDSKRFSSELLLPIINQTFEELKEDHVLVKKGTGVTDLFCIARRAIGQKRKEATFGYTAQMILSDDQKNNIREKRARRGLPLDETSRWIEKLEAPLGIEARSIADSVFASGSADFVSELLGGEGRDVGGDSIDQGRREAELDVLGFLGKNIFYVPVHVAGVPWFALLTLKENEQTAKEIVKDPGQVPSEIWAHNYHFYRTLVPQICDRIRVIAKQHYKKHLIEIFREEFRKNDKEENIINTINVRWFELTKFFPYSRLRIDDTNNDRMPNVTLPSGRVTKIIVTDNEHECFKNIIEFDLELNLFDLAAELNSISAHVADELQVRHFAMRTAASAIMSRNMSHNIGSNPLAREIKRLQRIVEARKKQALEMGMEPNLEFLDAWYEEPFLSYLRDRMDYLAEIATSDPSWSSVFNLRAICDDFNRQMILLYGLTRLEGSWRKPHCKLEVQQIDSSIQVAMPHGTLGVQALYSIFENMIRNSVQNAKQESTAHAGILSLDARDLGDCIELSMVDKGRPWSEEDHDLDSIINSRFDDPFYETSADGRSIGQLSPHNWGLKEMKISAAFMRLRSGWLTDAFFDDEGTSGYPSTKQTEWIWADWGHVDGDKKCLCHTIRLLKPKLAIIVGLPLNEAIQKRRRAFSDIGVEFESLDGFVERLNGILAHPYLLVDALIYDRIHEAVQKAGASTRLPIRIVKIGEHDKDSEAVELLDAFVRHIDGGIEGPSQLAAMIGALWNDCLARNAKITSGPRLVLATLNRQQIGRPKDSKVLWRDEKSISEMGASTLDGSADRYVIYERHSNTGTSINTNAWALTSIEQSKLWQKTAAYIGLLQGEDVSPYELPAIAHDSGHIERLIEAGLVWVVIVDERRKDDDEVRIQLARAGIVIIPVREEVVTDELRPQRICDQIDLATKQFGCRPGLVIISVHLAIVKTYAAQSRSTIAEWFVAARDALNARFDGTIEIMTHSGRGSPPELRELQDVRFVEFSNIDKLLTKPSDKPRLVELLMSVRRNN